MVTKVQGRRPGNSRYKLKENPKPKMKNPRERHWF
jgi:hypothetical protein